MSTEKDVPRLDPWLAFSAAGVVLLGIVMVASSSFALAEDSGLGTWHYAQRHLLCLGIGVLGGALLLQFPLNRLEKLGAFALLGSLLMLPLVFLPGLGVTVNGATRWLDFGLMRFQIAELVKVLMVIFLASYAARKHEAIRERFMPVLLPLALSGLVAGMLLLQPDFGSAALLLAVAITLLFLAGARLRYLLVLGLAGVPVMVFVALGESYRLRRLKSFLDPWADPYADGFQLTQALIAVGRGEWFGVGLGNSVQKLFYLPEAHSDFALAVLAEELGLAGVVLVISLFALLVGRSFWLALRALAEDQLFAGFLAAGLGLLLAFQTGISIGVNLGVLPTKGLTLPFISSGGSSVIASCLLLALLFRVSLELRAQGSGNAVRRLKPAQNVAEAKA